MQARQPQGAWENEQAHAFLIVCAIALLCWLFFDSVVYWTSWILYWLWAMVDFSQVHVWVAGKMNLLVSIANRAKDVTFDEWLNVMNQTSGVFLVFLVPLVLFCGFALAQHPMLPFRSKRLINVTTLPRLVSGFAPAVIPIVAATGPEGLMNDTSEAHDWAEKPEEFAEKHGLIKHKVLDRAKAKLVYESHLRKSQTALSEWEPYERALAAVFGLQVFLDDRKAAIKLLEDLNRSCLVKGLLSRKKHAFTPLYSLADKAFERVAATDGFSELLQTHGETRTVLAGLYGRDLRLAPAKFRWLKGVDRTLWYALHTSNTVKVYTEGGGIIAQARAELKAKLEGLPRPGVYVLKAVDGLQHELESIGLVYPRESAMVKQAARKTPSVIDSIFGIEPVSDE